MQDEVWIVVLKVWSPNQQYHYPPMPLDVQTLLQQGSPTPGPWTSTSLWPVRIWASRQKVSSWGRRQASSILSIAHITPDHTPLKSVEKLFSMEPVPGPQKTGDPWHKWLLITNMHLCPLVTPGVPYSFFKKEAPVHLQFINSSKCGHRDVFLNLTHSPRTPI